MKNYDSAHSIYDITLHLLAYEAMKIGGRQRGPENERSATAWEEFRPFLTLT